MSEVNRDVLRGRFQNGDRPDGGDFTNLIDSCLNKASDGLTIDGDGNLLLGRGLRLNNSATNQAGGLRFAGGQVQFNDGTNWLPLSGGGGTTFALNGTAAFYNAGNVGIGAFQPPNAAPTYRLEVNLTANTGPAEQVRFGNAVCSNGAGASGATARFSHRNHATNTNFALQQATSGAVQLNAPAGQAVSISQGGTSVQFGVSANGRTIVGGDTELLDGAVPSTAIFQVAGAAFKTQGGGSWAGGSDARAKDDVRELQEGLKELRRVRTVRYRYNGRGGTQAGHEGVGIIGQEIERIFPDTIERVRVNDPAGVIEDFRVFNPSALTFVLINAVKELADKVDQLERRLTAESEALA